MTIEDISFHGMRVTPMSAYDLFRHLTLGCTDYRDDWSDDATRLAGDRHRSEEVQQPFDLSVDIPVAPDHGVNGTHPFRRPATA